MTQTDSAYSAYVHCEPNGVSSVDSGGVARLAAGCVLALMLAFPNAAVADAEPEDVSGDSALLLDNVDVLSSASISTLMPATIGKGERWMVPASGEMHPVVTIGVPDTADLGRERPMMISTIERLSRAMPGTQFRLRVILSADGNAQLNIVKPDFMFAPSGADAIWQREGIESYRIATRKTASAKEAGKSVGSVLVTLKQREDLRDIADLKTKRSRPDCLIPFRVGLLFWAKSERPDSTRTNSSLRVNFSLSITRKSLRLCGEARPTLWCCRPACWRLLNGREWLPRISSRYCTTKAMMRWPASVPPISIRI